MSAVVGESTVTDAAVGVAITIRADSAWTVIFLADGAAVAIGSAAGVPLRPDAYTIINFDAFSSAAAYSDGSPGNFMSDAAGVYGLAPACGAIVSLRFAHIQEIRNEDFTWRGRWTYPAATHCVQVRSADPAMRDSDVDIGLFPHLGSERLVLHWGACVCGHPAVGYIFVASHYQGLDADQTSEDIWYSI